MKNSPYIIITKGLTRAYLRAINTDGSVTTTTAKRWACKFTNQCVREAVICELHAKWGNIATMPDGTTTKNWFCD